MWIVIILLIGVVAAGVVLFNGIVRKKYLVKEAYSGIDVQLKKRHQLIPNLVEVTKGYMGYEQKLLENVTSLRSKAEAAHGALVQGPVESGISSGLKNIIALAENYPGLKANSTFLELHKSLVDVEEQLQFARRYYNGAVRDYNTAIQMFPGVLIASLFHFLPADFFELELATERLASNVELGNKGA